MRVDIKGEIYFITTTTQDREKLFNKDCQIVSLVQIIKKACENHKSILYTYAVMPDHYHILVELGEEVSISRLLHSINSFFSYKHGKRKVDNWRDRPWNEVIRNENMFYQKMSYILLNPWRKNW